ncbi:MAG: SRPBCC family protein [Actinomycetota bacterium]|nr:SRPBCC family protein [Actinomycetota bacterium]
MKTGEVERSSERLFATAGTTSSKATTEQIGARLSDPKHWPRWQREIVDADGPCPLVDGDVVRGHARMLGFGVQGHATVTELNERCLEKDVIVGVRMRIRIDVDGAGTTRRVGYELVADLPRGPLGRCLSFFLKRRFKRMETLALRAFADL